MFEEIAQRNTKEIGSNKSMSPDMHKMQTVDYSRFFYKSRSLNPGTVKKTRTIASAESKRVASRDSKKLVIVEEQPESSPKKGMNRDATISMNSLNEVGSDLCSEETNLKIEANFKKKNTVPEQPNLSKMSVAERKAMIQKLRKQNQTIFQEHRKIKSQEYLYEDHARNSIQAKLALEQLV